MVSRGEQKLSCLLLSAASTCRCGVRPRSSPTWYAVCFIPAAASSRLFPRASSWNQLQGQSSGSGEAERDLSRSFWDLQSQLFTHYRDSCCLSLPSVMAAPAEGSVLSLGGYGAGYRCPQPLGGKERVRGNSGAGRAQSKNPWLCLWVRPGGKLSRIRVLWSWLLGSGSLV